MSKRVLTIILLISLFLNAGIIGGLIVMNVFRHNHIEHHYQRPPDGPPPNNMGRFAPPDRFDPQIVALRDSFIKTKRELMEELSKDPIDEAKVKAIIEKSVEAQSNMERAMGYKMLEWRKTMSAQEAKELFSSKVARLDTQGEKNNQRRKAK